MRARPFERTSSSAFNRSARSFSRLSCPASGLAPPLHKEHIKAFEDMPGERNGRSPQIRCDLDFPHASDRMLQRSHLNERSVNAILRVGPSVTKLHGVSMAGCLFAKLGAVLDLFAMNRKTHCLARKNVRIRRPETSIARQAGSLCYLHRPTHGGLNHPSRAR